LLLTWTSLGNYKNIKTVAKESLGYYELKQHKPRFDEGCSELLDQRKQDKLLRLQYPSQINAENVNNLIRGANRNFRNNKGWISEIQNLAIHSKNKNIRHSHREIN
jgi:hypothetical protein